MIKISCVAKQSARLHVLCSVYCLRDMKQEESVRKKRENVLMRKGVFECACVFC